MRYPVENPLLLASELGKQHSWGPDSFWVLDAQAGGRVASGVRDG